ncbi:MAG: DUF167 domain-containing protein, partial [Patescibacteria group bacterium]|nr:DUF167 domain-containing protein [Patescibacteria group bacterium]
MLIKVKVAADARAEKVVKKADDLFVVSVREPAERGEANERVLELLRLEHPGKPVRLVSGHLKPSK